MQNTQIQGRSNATAASYTLKDWQGGYRSQPIESNYWIDEIEGKIPQELSGTLFRNGPGLLDVNGQRLHHPFDGDGMVCAIAFSKGRAYFRNRFVQTSGFLEEQAAGKILYRGVFGTQKPGGWLANAFDLRQKNIANTQVIYWGGKLLALWEAAAPHRLDPHTLETLGIDHLEGILHSGEAFAAHPRVDQVSGKTPTLVNFAIKPGLSSKITIYELDPDGKLLQRHSHSVPGFAFIHDFALTPNYCLFFQNPMDLNPLPYAVGIKGAAECIKFRPEQATKIWVIPRDTTKPMQVLETRSGFIFHHANAFEQDDKIYVDSICYESFPSVEPGQDYLQTHFPDLTPGQLWRFELDLSTKTVERQLLESRCCEFPFVHPAKMGQPHRYIFMGAVHQPEGNAPLQAILKLDIATGKRQLWSAAPRGFVGEPVFVPRPEATGEDNGWVMTLVYDAASDRSDLVILDARDLEKQPLARLHLKHHIPYGLHGTWTPQCFAPSHAN
jgi:all-trans-8'-apo-beta-carotenal 15,15'-oxygenase